MGVITAGVIDGLGQHAIEAKVDSTKVSNTDFDEECIEEIPDCSLGEVSLSFGAATSEEERRRLFSQSDNNVDIRNLILGRTFVLCFCDNVIVVVWFVSF